MADEEFLKRWSRDKLTKTHDADSLDSIVEIDEEQAALPDIPESETDAPDDQPPPDLPPIDSLDSESDYTPFLGENVPEELTRKALRKLWSSDPVFANLDGLNDYDDDYSKLGIVKTIVETAYKVGKGIVSEDEQEPDEELLVEKEVIAEEKVPEDNVEDIEEGVVIAADDDPIQLSGELVSPFLHGGKNKH
ncbi:MAG: DUF3306 domain-containing protein [Rhodospirillales bacterium]|jgi:hypothetical protein|nr:DUF3306 domain-containing protein [Rhodospirillales bacterium]